MKESEERRAKSEEAPAACLGKMTDDRNLLSGVRTVLVVDLMRKLQRMLTVLFLLAIFFGLLIMINPVYAVDAITQQTTAEQDYERGYEDGYQAYEDGFYGMPQDTEESKTYEDGFADVPEGEHSEVMVKRQAARLPSHL